MAGWSGGVTETGGGKVSVGITSTEPRRVSFTSVTVLRDEEPLCNVTAYSLVAEVVPTGVVADGEIADEPTAPGSIETPVPPSVTTTAVTKKRRTTRA